MNTTLSDVRRNAVRSAHAGGTLLIALVIASVVLSIGISVSGIVSKELILLSITRNSGSAFYAADGALECALYWDVKNPNNETVFATSSSSIPPINNIYCWGTSDVRAENISNCPGSGWCIEQGATRATTTFMVRFDQNDSGMPCAEVRVSKEDMGGNVIRTTIDARGRSSCDSNNPRRVERGLKVSY